jgi:hypothetical protein
MDLVFLNTVRTNQALAERQSFFAEGNLLDFKCGEHC